MALQQSTAQIVIGTRQLEQLIARVAAASDTELYPLLDAIGQQQEDSARRRIRETKRAPDGTRWEPWSEDYAKTRGPQHSLLVGEGNLADTLSHEVGSEKDVYVGSSMVYAGRHLHGDFSFMGPVRGGGRIPARPYLDTDGGFADPSDREEIRDLVREFMGEIL